MADAERPRLPQTEPHEARRRAEDLLGLGEVDIPQATAWALVAIAGELAEIRRTLRRR
ncbi:hypothetical protein ACIP9H_29345 [Streptomyces sp. NPDC088732]|uniref:hypothetical protein n=1 Tax=Streptomyces sp. NPDC088732 TaxID=3365879 RepID=UPI0037FB0DFB